MQWPRCNIYFMERFIFFISSSFFTLVNCLAVALLRPRGFLSRFSLSRGFIISSTAIGLTFLISLLALSEPIAELLWFEFVVTSPSSDLILVCLLKLRSGSSLTGADCLLPLKLTYRSTKPVSVQLHYEEFRPRSNRNIVFDKNNYLYLHFMERYWDVVIISQHFAVKPSATVPAFLVRDTVKLM